MVDVATAVVVVEVGSIGKDPTMRTLLATENFQVVLLRLNTWKEEDPLKDAVVMVDPVLSVVVDKVVLVMEKCLRGTGLVGHLNAVVVLDAGRYIFLVCVTSAFLLPYL